MWYYRVYMLVIKVGVSGGSGLIRSQGYKNVTTTAMVIEGVCRRNLSDWPSHVMHMKSQGFHGIVPETLNLECSKKRSCW